MTRIGTPFSDTATRVLMCGAGELGKEVVIELQRLGVEVIACDRYENAPAMQVADRSYAFSMLDGKTLREVIEKEKPDLIVPEIEAIATDTLRELEGEGWNVIPTARAAGATFPPTASACKNALALPGVQRELSGRAASGCGPRAPGRNAPAHRSEARRSRP